MSGFVRDFVTGSDVCAPSDGAGPSNAVGAFVNTLLGSSSKTQEQLREVRRARGAPRRRSRGSHASARSRPTAARRAAASDRAVWLAPWPSGGVDAGGSGPRCCCGPRLPPRRRPDAPAGECRGSRQPSRSRPARSRRLLRCQAARRPPPDCLPGGWRPPLQGHLPVDAFLHAGPAPGVPSMDEFEQIYSQASGAEPCCRRRRRRRCCAPVCRRGRGDAL
jgi:hypothetical protein